MKIIFIHIYGFGQFENTQFKLPEAHSLHAVLGENEAGKSTIKAFIQAILFGFPTRNQAENRYEPKTGAKYGGMLTIKLESGKYITIERVAGRATGELSISFEDGSVGGEERLFDILKGLDRSIYESIFSFGLKGLQAIETIKSAELSHYLFSAGASGSQGLFELEKKLQKKIDTLYKPNGSKPLLNQKINELDYLHSQLKKWKEKIDLYNQYIDEQNHLKNTTEQLEQQSEQIKIKIKQFEKKQMIQPYVEERKKLIRKLQQLKAYQPFPVDGMNRLQELKLQLTPLKGQYDAIQEKLTIIETELQTMIPNKDYLNAEPRVNALKETSKAIEIQERELEKIALSIDIEQTEIQNLIDILGRHYTEEMIAEIETSLAVKGTLKGLVKEDERLKEQQPYLNEQFKHAKRELEDTEKYIQDLTEEDQKRKRRVTIFYSIILIMLGGAVWWFTKNLSYSFGIVAVSLSVFWLAVKFLKSGKAYQLEREQITLKKKQLIFEEIVKNFEKWEQDKHKVQTELSDFCQTYKLPHDINGAQLINVFESLEEAKKRIRTKVYLKKEMNHLQETIQAYNEAVRGLLSLFNIQAESIRSALERVSLMVEQEKEKQNEFKQLQHKRNDLLDQRLSIMKQLDSLEGEITSLYMSAEAKGEGEFREKGKRYEQYGAIKDQLKTVEDHLHAVLKPDEAGFVEEVESENVNYKSGIKQLEEKLSGNAEEQKHLQLKIADLAVQIRNLEEGTTYSTLIHKFEVEKSIFQEEARQWAIYQIAKDFLHKTKHFYREVRLPKVIKKAQEYFSFLTDGNYRTVYAPTENNGFIVERVDGIPFHPTELSQATKEQLYLALRLALASSYRSASPFPILIDDSFVNFDQDRTSRSIQLVKEIAMQHQVLFFTCHKRIADFFNQPSVISLERKHS